MTRQKPVSQGVRLARGRNLLRERLRSGLTLEALGERVGVKGEQVRKYQIGRDYLGPVWCWRFAKALGCTFAHLFDTHDVEGVAEDVATFTHAADDGEAARLDELLARAQARLTGTRRTDLREILLDLLEHEERSRA